MGRAHLFEFNDQPWLPDFLRDAMTGYLETISRKFKMHEVMTPIVQEALTKSESTQIVDLCSGGLGPILEIRKHLEGDVPVVLTDKFPNQTAFEAAEAPGVTPMMTPVDATAVPESLTGLRTIFNALHHFRPDTARAILKDAFDKNKPIAVFELSERTVANILSAPLIFLFTLLFMPFVKPTRWQYWIFTYLIPIIPMLITFDGLVSHLRVYSPDELRGLIEGMDRPDYAWEIKRVQAMPGAHITVLTGTPTS